VFFLPGLKLNRHYDDVTLFQVQSPYFTVETPNNRYTKRHFVYRLRKKYKHIAENKDQSVEEINNCAIIFYFRFL